MNELPVSEKELSKSVEDLLDIYKWCWCHQRPARTARGWRTPLSGHKGFLDYIAVKNGRLLIFELKSEKGRLSPDQRIWYLSLGRAGVKVYIWKPSDIGEIESILKGD